MTISKAPDDWAAAVADGDVVDWQTLALQASSPQARRQIEHFALLARLAGVYAETPSDVSIHAQEDWGSPPRGTWGQLRLLERLGAGTSGTVYRAHDSALSRDVALKVLQFPPSTDGAALDAVREGRLLARVRHPNVVTVYGADQRDGRIGVWMELVEGRTLEDELAARGPLSPQQVAHVGQVLASALQAVHDAGLIHRDVKAQNVMRDSRDGRLVLMDFSAGREQADHDARSAWPATIVGSPLYLAPELFAGAPATTQSDVYSLGVLLFRLLTGRFPFVGDTMGAIQRAQETGGGSALRLLPPSTPAALRRVIGTAMAAADQRYRTARALADDLAVSESRASGVRRGRATMAAGTLVTLVPVGYLLMTLPAPSRVSGEGASTHAHRVVPATDSRPARALVAQAENLMFASAGRHPDDIRASLDDADRLLVQATTLDAMLAYAWMLRARIVELRQQSREKVLPLMATATRMMDSAGPAERAAIAGYAHRVRADLAAHRRDELLASAKAYEAVLRVVPGDYWSLVELEQIYQRLQRSADADRVALVGALHHPRSVHLAAAAARVHLQRRDQAALRTLVRRALEGVRADHYRYPHPGAVAYSTLLLAEARQAWLVGDLAGALDAIRRVASTHVNAHNDAVWRSVTDGLETLGRFEEARTFAARIDDVGARVFRFALLDARQQRWDDLRLWLHPGGVQPAVPHQRFSFMYIWAGRLDEARHLLSLFRTRRIPAAWQVVQEFEAQLRAAEGRYQEALDLFAPLLVDETAPRLGMHEVVARARLGVGDEAGALTILERIESEPILATWPGFSGVDWLRCVVLLAEVHSGAGRAAEAARVAARARAYLALADADHPLRARVASLP